ncbi:MAG: hypothetical protein V7K58_22420 [Nostoc sp.]
MATNTARLSLKNHSGLGWVEERNPTRYHRISEAVPQLRQLVFSFFFCDRT